MRGAYFHLDEGFDPDDYKYDPVTNSYDVEQFWLQVEPITGPSTLETTAKIARLLFPNVNPTTLHNFHMETDPTGNNALVRFYCELPADVIKRAWLEVLREYDMESKSD